VQSATLWTALGSIATVLTLLLSVWLVLKKRKPSSRTVFLSDSEGRPETQVSMVFEDGHHLEPNADGLITLPRDRVGAHVSIRDRKSRRELCTALVSDRLNGTYRVIVRRPGV
jgi:hypothetical protein